MSSVEGFCLGDKEPIPEVPPGSYQLFLTNSLKGSYPLHGLITDEVWSDKSSPTLRLSF